MIRDDDDNKDGLNPHAHLQQQTSRQFHGGLCMIGKWYYI